MDRTNLISRLCCKRQSHFVYIGQGEAVSVSRKLGVRFIVGPTSKRNLSKSIFLLKIIYFSSFSASVLHLCYFNH